MNIDLNLHEYKSFLKLKKHNEVTHIFDPIRKKYISLQPEEIVRQLLLYYFIENNVYPKSLIQVEKGITVNGMLRRFDVVVYDKSIQPYILIEVKAHTAKLNQKAFDQAARYNIALKAPYLMVTNGVTTICAHIDHTHGTYDYISALPPLPLE